MKALFSTRKTQGDRSNDFNFVSDGELVYPSWVCDRDKNSPNAADGSCGCARSMSGVKLGKGTTTFVVGEFDGDLLKEIENSLIRGGWGKQFAPEIVDTIKMIASEYPIGTILERRGENAFRVRETVKR